ncbi:uncharacterized protein LOC119586653 [Penaeus monodon]|uniref:uncharacterized protein LOC119586653 n=1 Tax=Penaeus monodon TaxID=6687 RepID=UPI0018A7D154|nr:uncharacterized protein LOC119586653 [Penaeus monodon]
MYELICIYQKSQLFTLSPSPMLTAIFVIHSKETDDWTLQVQYSQPRDSGAYKCQVNSDPKIVRNVYLSVTVLHSAMELLVQLLLSVLEVNPEFVKASTSLRRNARDEYGIPEPIGKTIVDVENKRFLDGNLYKLPPTNSEEVQTLTEYGSAPNRETISL